MKKQLYISLLLVVFIIIWGCAIKKSPGEPLTSPTNTPTPNLTPINITTQLTKTCLTVDTCSAGGSATNCVAEDSIGNIWAAEMTACAWFMKYDSSGNTLFAKTAPPISGMSCDKNNDWVWYIIGYGTGSLFGVEAYESSDGNFGTAGANRKAAFSVSKATNEDYFGITFDGQDLWTIKHAWSDNSWHCYKYSTSGIELLHFQILNPVNGGQYWSISYGGGYLWLSSYNSTESYIYQIDTSGNLISIVTFNDMCLGLQWVSQNTFWIAALTEVCRISY